MKHTLPITLILVGFFVLAQLIGLGLLSAHLHIEEYVNPTTNQIERNVTTQPTVLGDAPNLTPQSAFISLIFAVTIGTLLALFLIRLKKVKLWKAWYGLAIFFALSIAFDVLLPGFIAMILAGIIALLRIFKPTTFLQNISELFIYAGITIVFAPLLTPFLGVLLLVLIAIYDAYAVWKSKHMVTLAEFQTSTNTFAGLHFPAAKKPTKKESKKSSQTTKKTSKQGSAILGGGDIAFPLLFSGIVLVNLFTKYSPLEAFLRTLVITLCATISLCILFFISKKKRYYPAMVFLSAGCLVGLAILEIS